MEQTQINPFPTDPLKNLDIRGEDAEAYYRRVVKGILESYNSNYDILAELLQNAVDAIEDAEYSENLAPPLIEVTINLIENWISVLDTGVGMTSSQLTAAFAPYVSFKNNPEILEKRGTKSPYRGYKGVGLTFLSYGTDKISIHTKQRNGAIYKGKMEYGRAWVFNERPNRALVIEDEETSPLENYNQGTFIKIQLSQKTRPKSLRKITHVPQVWATILRTRTAIGQISFGSHSITPVQCRLNVIDQNSETSLNVDSTFLFPNKVIRKPEFRFLDVSEYWSLHGNHTRLENNVKRQDGIHIYWNTKEIKNQLSKQLQEVYQSEIEEYLPELYAFLPYQTSIWNDINIAISGNIKRIYLNSGLIIAVNRQRLADTFEIEPTRFDTLSKNLFVLVHFNNARPDQGRKTVQEEVLELAKKIADRALQYMARQRDFLRAPGEAPTPEQRQVEKDHDDWLFNVRMHEKNSPLHIPPIVYQSIPLTEQDVIGLFHELAVLGVFPGIEIYATSQSKTYDCLVRYNTSTETQGLTYRASDENALGLSKFVLGEVSIFSTSTLTLEFKNNIDGLIEDIDNDNNRKNFSHIDICVCWSTVSNSFKGYSIEEITETNLEERKFPGITHLLRRDSDNQLIQVVMLKSIIDMIKAGRIQIR